MRTLMTSLPLADRTPDDLRSIIDSEVVRPCLDAVFRSGELRRSALTITEHDGRLYPDGDPDYGPIIRLELETSEGDVAAIPVWQPEVEQLSTIAGIREYLLGQLEDWLPETRLHWGEEVHLLPSPDGPKS